MPWHRVRIQSGYSEDTVRVLSVTQETHVEAVDTQRVSVLAQEDGESRKCGSVYGAGGHGCDRFASNRGFLKVTGKSI